MPKPKLDRIILRGYKSIKECELELSNLNVLIGPNGAGKSNFISFFKLLQQLLQLNLQVFTGKQGGPDALLRFGRKTTQRIEAELYFGYNGYKLALEPTADNRLIIASEKFWWNIKGDWHIAEGQFESLAHKQKGKTKIYDYTIPAMLSWQVFHFHDTGDTSPMKGIHQINDNQYFRPDGGNLAAFLYRLSIEHPKILQEIEETVALVAPFFKAFVLRPNIQNKNFIELEWFERGSDRPFKAFQLSDGTLRFICLCTLLLQPEELCPTMIIIDEPELGLHPFAISILAELIQSAAMKTQAMISTQSVNLLSCFEIEDVVVADRTSEGSVFKRLSPEQYAPWLEDYSLSEIWEKNLIGGLPHE